MAKTTHDEILNIPGPREMQIKISLRLHLTPIRMATIKKTNKYKCWQGCEEKGTLIRC
jgi:hypothetical protein